MVEIFFFLFERRRVALLFLFVCFFVADISMTNLSIFFVTFMGTVESATPIMFDPLWVPLLAHAHRCQKRADAKWLAVTPSVSSIKNICRKVDGENVSTVAIAIKKINFHFLFCLFIDSDGVSKAKVFLHACGVYRSTR